MVYPEFFGKTKPHDNRLACKCQENSAAITEKAAAVAAAINVTTLMHIMAIKTDCAVALRWQPHWLFEVLNLEYNEIE